MLAAALTASADPTGTLSGRIVDASTGRPVPDVRIGTFSPAGNRSGRSSRDGTFALIGLAPGRTVVTLEAPGYGSRECAYRLAPGGDTRLRFALRANDGRDGEGAGDCPRAPVGDGQTQDVYVIGS
ncbi:MAG: hypothetical protein NVSMB19_24560 [Vulcanimicrobiaceae bacterium]